MRKHICTATIFLAFLGVAASLILVQVPEHVWWSKDHAFNNGAQEPLFFWFLGNFAVPAIFLAGGFGVLAGLWFAASSICAKLRGDA